MREEIELLAENLHVITKDQAWHYRILPKEKNDTHLVFYCEESVQKEELILELEVIIGLSIELCPVEQSQISRLLSKHYIRDTISKGVRSSSINEEDFLENIIAEAKNLHSSDIHIEVYENRCRVRIRIDGKMIERYHLKIETYPALINKIKVLANLDIAEKRLPQDGRITFKHLNSQFDIRVSILPTLYGEKVVLRLLNNDATNIDIMKVGFSDFDLGNYIEGVCRPNGILLISGPTGSGKTTTLYATLKYLNKDSRNILTIEDPIEYTLEGINQVQLRESIGLGFSEALKTFLRQDPDVIMVGEIRDQATANMAIRAALTGHLVLSTIHTNSAWGTISRLIDMGIPPFMVANTLNTSVAQRLVRLLCDHCKTKAIFSETQYPKQFQPGYELSHHYVAKGCENCHYTGYKGRKAVYEVITIDQELSVEIKKANMDVHDLLKQRKIFSLAENAFQLFSDGLTSMEEIYPLLINF